MLLWGRDHWRLRLHMWNSVDGRTVAAVDARLGLYIVGTSCSFSYHPTFLLAVTAGDWLVWLEVGQRTGQMAAVMVSLLTRFQRGIGGSHSGVGRSCWCERSWGGREVGP